jgi:hypothetical protein
MYSPVFLSASVLARVHPPLGALVPLHQRLHLPLLLSSNPSLAHSNFLQSGSDQARRTLNLRHDKLELGVLRSLRRVLHFALCTVRLRNS